MIPGQHLHQLIFDLFRVLGLCQAQLPADTLHMGIHHDARLLIDVSPDHVGRFPANSRQRRQAFQIGGDPAAVF